MLPGASAAQQLTAAERAYALATVWAEARYNFAYWDHVRADWDSALTANLKLAAKRVSAEKARNPALESASARRRHPAGGGRRSPT